MHIKEFGSTDNPAIMLLHGGGLSWWSWQPVINLLQDRFHIIAPVLKGHGESASEPFVSIEDTADELIELIRKDLNGKVHAIAGLSIGAQILCEILSKDRDITDNAIIESALLLPLPGTKSLTAPMVSMSYPLIRYRWFAKAQARTLSLPDDLFESYYQDSLHMTKASLVNMTVSNGTYMLKDTIRQTYAKVQIIVGEKELKIMKKSAQRLNNLLPDSQLYVAPGMKHGEPSLKNPAAYVNYLV